LILNTSHCIAISPINRVRGSGIDELERVYSLCLLGGFESKKLFVFIFSEVSELVDSKRVCGIILLVVGLDEVVVFLEDG